MLFFFFSDFCLYCNIVYIFPKFNVLIFLSFVPECVCMCVYCFDLISRSNYFFFVLFHILITINRSIFYLFFFLNSNYIVADLFFFHLIIQKKNLIKFMYYVFFKIFLKFIDADFVFIIFFSIFETQLSIILGVCVFFLKFAFVLYNFIIFKFNYRLFNVLYKRQTNSRRLN